MSAKFIPTSSGTSALGGSGGGGGGPSFSYVSASGGSEWNEGFADGNYRFHRFQSGGTSSLSVSSGGIITIWAWGAAGGRGGHGSNGSGEGGDANNGNSALGIQIAGASAGTGNTCTVRVKSGGIIQCGFEGGGGGGGFYDDPNKSSQDPVISGGGGGGGAGRPIGVGGNAGTSSQHGPNGDAGTNATTDQVTFGGTYTAGAVTAGIQMTSIDKSAVNSDRDRTHIAASFAVNEDLSVSWGMSTVEFEGGNTDQEDSGFSVSYTMGSMSLTAAANNHNVSVSI